uniref:Fe2OG dioxygenase domain-containing protein n=1 Tax=Leersia perrieri TaxID=77586 RepID=A0A0D9XMD4_9ORYZ
MTYYPPCWQADKVMGISPHTDVAGLILLLQVNDVQVLQIKRDGKWFSVDAPNSAIIVNIGDTLEILSNGKFRSVAHRTVINPNKERISASLFHCPCEDMVISPLPEFVKDGKVKYRSISFHDLMTQFFTQQLDGRNKLEILKNLGIAMAGARTVGSLPVPNVQELARTCNGPDEHIPERYIIRTDDSSDEVICNYQGDMAIPIIDLNKLLSPQSSDEECVKLRSACQYWGFFQLINHGVPDEVIANFKRDVVDFFSQPLDAKEEYKQLPNSIEGYGHAFVFSDDQKLDWADQLYVQVHPRDSRDLRFWPTSPASFRQSIDAYSSETNSLALCLFEFMAKAVGAKPELLVGIFEDQLRGIRMAYYPPCRQADKVMGISPHTDVVGLTLLLQINDVQGLQIKRDGKWFSVDAPNNAIIANIGDTLEILSNGKFRSVEHRAVIHPNKERISASLFHYPCENMMISPLPEFVKDDKVKYKSISYHDFMKQFFTQQLDGRNRGNHNKQCASSNLEKIKIIMSLPVPNVQELAWTCNRLDRQIPERYVRPEAGTGEVVSGCDINAAIPVIDLARLLDPRSSQEECAKLGSACQHWGFFQLINHGVPDEVINNMREDLIEFFRLPLEAKEAYAKPIDKLEGYGQHFVVSEKQKLDWGDLLYLRLRPTESRDMSLWPAHPPSFRGPPQTLRANYYPQCRQAGKVLGLSPHCDSGGLTLLLQMNNVQGLQIRKGGKWLAVDALDDAFIVNVGDTLEILSNGRYKSIEHGATVHPEKERISAALFHHVSPNSIVGPLPELVKDGGKPLYKMVHEDFMKRFVSAKLDGRANELAQTCNRPYQEIPERYIRPEVGTDEIISGHDINSAIPVIDLAKLLDPQSSQEECAKLGSACQHWGFFQLINHGVPDEVINDVREDLTEFFRLPLETKQAYAKPTDKFEGYGQHFVVSERQKLDWGDLLHLRLRPTESRDMSFWPAHPPSFRNSMERYSSETAKLARCLFEFLAMDMGVDPESLLEIFRGQPQTMRANYYPPCRQADKVLGLSPHCDATSLTLLLQVNDVQGLQIRKDGKWLAVNALDGAFIINIGDMLEVLSNGRYRSIEHRAMVNPEKERISAAVFHQACRKATIGPLPELVMNNGGKPLYKSMGYEDFMKRFFSAKLDGRANVEGLRIQNSRGLATDLTSRYLRGTSGQIEAGAGEVISGCDINAAIPIIDLAKLLDPQLSQDECAKRGSACQHWGFFQLINHSVPDKVINDMREDLTEFFRLPLETKQAYAKPTDKFEGYGQHFVVSEKQKLDWGDLLHLRLRPTESRDMSFWPAHPQSSRYSSETATVANCLLKFLAKDMGVDPESLLDIFGGQPQTLRANYYPPCRQAGKVLGLSPHCDSGGLTLLLQVNNVQGLQIRKDGNWLAVNALDDAIIVNVGDTLEILSNGRYKSIEHRAVVHPEKERISAAVFHHVSGNSTVGPLPELVKDGGKPVYKSMAHEDFMKRFFSDKLDGRANVDGLRI